MSRPGGVAARLYRACLRVLPKRVRNRYGREMSAVFEEELAEKRGLGWVRFVLRSFWGLGVTAVLERVRWRGESRGQGGALTRGLGMDLRLACRSLIRRPGLSAATLITLTIGIGLNTAVFSLVNGLLLRPLPYGEPDRLVQLSETAADMESMDVSLPDFHYWRANTEVFSGMFAFDDHAFLLSTPDRPEILEGAVVSPGFLAVLGIEPTLGRDFVTEEERPGRNGVAVISEALWERRFARDPGVLGSTLELSGRPYEVVGVAPAGFHFPEVAQVWIPLAFEATEADPQDYGYDVVARLVPGASVQSARLEGRRVAGALAAAANGRKDGIGATAYPLRMADVPLPLAGSVLLLQVAVLLVLLVACTNVASLLLARGEVRRGEMAVRSALGAGLGRLLRQHLTEVGLVASVGLFGALVLARFAVAWLPILLPGDMPFWLSFDLDSSVLLFSGTVAVLCCVGVAVPTTVQARRAPRLAGGVTDRRVVSGGGRRWLVGGQLALALVLVAAAAVTLRGVARLSQTATGVRIENVLVTSAPLPAWTYEDQADRLALTRRVVDAVQSLPGVVSAAAIDVVPLVSGGREVALDPGGDPGARAPVGLLNAFSPGYFETMGIPVLEGRLPGDSEGWTNPDLAVVSQSLARRFWPDGGAVGRRIRYGTPESRDPRVSPDRPWLEVVAVVGDVLQAGPVRETRDQVYVTMARETPAHLTLMVHTGNDPLALLDAVEERVHEIDPTLPFYEPTTMEQARRFSVWIQRLTATLLTAFGVLAGSMAILGVYAVMAHTTRRRDREIGLRVAVGASGRDVRRLVLRDSMELILPGLVVGLVGAGVSSVLLQRLVAGAPGGDPLLVLAVAAVLAAAALGAAWLPARRAAGVDPSVALSSD